LIGKECGLSQSEGAWVIDKIPAAVSIIIPEYQVLAGGRVEKNLFLLQMGGVIDRRFIIISPDQ
jgi:hypothetical protein